MTHASKTTTPAMKLEVVVIPVSDVDRAKAFYAKLGWRLDADFTDSKDWRVIQFTPPGSAQGLYLVVSDIEAARRELRDRGVDVSEVFHADSVVHSGTHEPFLAGRNRVNGAAPERQTYGSYASFSDPDGNGWLFQEVTTRLPGRVEGDTTFSSSAEIASALRRAAVAHGEHEKRNGGQHDVNWPDWYADYIAKEQAGQPLPL
jgi:catechol 2,3-dioxygenase-like lactoylglutathione lyase family enzyme